MDLVIFAMEHRTGSTLLQRICNARKNTLIWGEHGGFLNYLTEGVVWLNHFSKASESERNFYFGENHNPNRWIANMTPEKEYVDKAIQKVVRGFYDDLYEQYSDTHDMIGFKEVRYEQPAIELFRKHYPDTQILLLTRHPVDMWKSGPDWYNDVDHMINKWNKQARFFKEMADKEENTHLIRYEDIVNRNPQTLQKIKEVAKVTDKEIELVLGKKLRSTRREVDSKEAQRIAEECQLKLIY